MKKHTFFADTKLKIDQIKKKLESISHYLFKIEI